MNLKKLDDLFEQFFLETWPMPVEDFCRKINKYYDEANSFSDDVLRNNRQHKKFREELLPLAIFLNPCLKKRAKIVYEKKNSGSPPPIHHVNCHVDLNKSYPIDATLTTDQNEHVKIEITSGNGDEEYRKYAAKHARKYRRACLYSDKEDLHHASQKGVNKRAKTVFLKSDILLHNAVHPALFAINQKSKKNNEEYKNAILLVRTHAKHAPFNFPKLCEIVNACCQELETPFSKIHLILCDI